MKRSLFCVVAAMVVIAACSSDPKIQAERFVAAGDSYVGQHKYKEAILEYRNAITAQPSRADVHYKLARAYMETGDAVKAYGSFSQAADLDPSNVDAQLQSGELLLMAGQYDEARARAELALKADAKSARAHILFGNALSGLNDTTRAIKQMEQAITLDPEYALAYAALGAVQLAGGRAEKARESFERAVQLDPKSVGPRLALANYNWAVGDHPAAERELKAALEADPANTLAHRAMALFYLSDRRAPEAEPHFKMLASDSPEGALALADFYTGLGRRDEALAVLKGISDKKAQREARLRIATIQYESGKTKEALSTADALIAEKPRNPDAHILKARLLLAGQGDWTKRLDRRWRRCRRTPGRRRRRTRPGWWRSLARTTTAPNGPLPKRRS